jgi:hypothetical protein
LAWVLVAASAALLPIEFLSRSLNPLDLDARAFAAAAACGFVATVLAGWIPAWIGTRSTQPQQMLDRTTTETRSARWLTRALLVTEVALACALLAGAAVLVQSFVNLSRIDVGFDPRGIVAVWVETNAAIGRDPTARSLAMTTVAAELAGLPGVHGVVASRGAPMFVPNGMSWGDWQPDGPGSVPVEVQVEQYTVAPGWFDMYRIRLLAGRDFAAGEAPHHVILSRTLAASLWPDASPLGRSFLWDAKR